MIVKTVSLLFNQVVFLIQSCKISLYIPDRRPLSSFASIFSQSVGSLSLSFMVLFEVQNHVSMGLAYAVSIIQCINLCDFETLGGLVSLMSTWQNACCCLLDSWSRFLCFVLWTDPLALTGRNSKEFVDVFTTPSMYHIC